MLILSRNGSTCGLRNLRNPHRRSTRELPLCGSSMRRIKSSIRSFVKAATTAFARRSRKRPSRRSEQYRPLISSQNSRGPGPSMACASTRSRTTSSFALMCLRTTRIASPFGWKRHKSSMWLSFNPAFRRSAKTPREALRRRESISLCWASSCAILATCSGSLLAHASHSPAVIGPRLTLLEADACPQAAVRFDGGLLRLLVLFFMSCPIGRLRTPFVHRLAREAHSSDTLGISTCNLSCSVAYAIGPRSRTPSHKAALGNARG